jgi:hypothetical protein
MSLATQIEADLAFMLNTSELSRSLLYTPAGGTVRTIVGNTNAGSEYVDTATGRHKVDFLDVFVLRDATDGIDDPQEGDRIELDSKSYSYCGPVIQQHEHDWTLRFHRDIPTKHGGLPSR